MLAQKAKKVAMVTQARSLYEPVPSYSLPGPIHDAKVLCLVTLEDDSFVTCSADNTAKRWMRDTTNKTIRLLGTYSGHTKTVIHVIEKDDNTLLTASADETLKVWNTTTCECLETFPKRVSALLRTKSKSTIVCGLLDGTVEMRRVSDLSLLSSFQVHSSAVLCLCELEDGSFVSGAGTTLLVWDETGTPLHSHNTEHECFTSRIIEMKRGIIASAVATKVKLWSPLVGWNSQTFSQFSYVKGLEKINERFLVSGSLDGQLVVWDRSIGAGSWHETHQCHGKISAMTKLRDGSIVTTDSDKIEIRW